jgi:hypothetical protein
MSKKTDEFVASCYVGIGAWHRRHFESHGTSKNIVVVWHVQRERSARTPAILLPLLLFLLVYARTSISVVVESLLFVLFACVESRSRNKSRSLCFWSRPTHPRGLKDPNPGYFTLRVSLGSIQRAQVQTPVHRAAPNYM